MTLGQETKGPIL